MELKGLRGSSSTRIDDKGRLKLPTIFRGVITDQHGPDVFVTSLTGECVRIYPMPVWLEMEQKLSRMPANHPSRLKFLDRVNYYGQAAELDPQGRIVVPAHLRESASIVGDVRVFGRIHWPAGERWSPGAEMELFAERVDFEGDAPSIYVPAFKPRGTSGHA